MRTFRFSDAKSHKFWNIELAGNGYTVTYGKVGTAGQTSSKEFASPEAAEAAAEKLIREKTGKGYTETTPKATVSPTEAFLLGLVDNPHDAVRWLAFSDLLSEKDDPRGEFIRLQLELEAEDRTPAQRKALKEREAELLALHERTWLGALAAEILDAEPVPHYEAAGRTARAPVAHQFIRGWLGRLEFHNLTVKQARAYATASEARLVRDLIVETIANEAPEGATQQYIDSYYAPGPDVPADLDPYEDPGLHALCRCPHLASVRSFQLGEGTGDEEYSNCHTSGRLAHSLVQQMPNLERLALLAHRVDANKLFALPMPRLESLLLFHSHSYPLEKLAANSSLTNLETLRCHPHALEHDDDEEGAYIRLSQLRAICRSPHLFKLSHLCLRLTDFGDAGVKEIVQSGMLKRLTVLDLQGGCITDVGAKLLADYPDLKRLHRLNLNTNALTEKGIALLEATGVPLTAVGQHGQVPGDGETPEYLFEGDIE